MPRRPENPDRPLTPRDIARGLQRSGNDPDTVRRNLAKVRAVLEQSGKDPDTAAGKPSDVSAEDWEEYLAMRDDERRRKEYGEHNEAENPPSA